LDTLAMAPSRPESWRRASFVALVAICVTVALPIGAGAAPRPSTALRVGPPPGAVDFGASVAGLGDVDGDGVADAAVGAPGTNRAYLVSGGTGTILRQVADPGRSALDFGFAVAGVGDVDRDGVADVAVGAPSGSDPSRARTLVFSGATGAALRHLAPPTTGGHVAFGRSVAGAGDVSGDGVPDVVVSAPALGQGLGAVFAFSGADGAQLWSRPAPAHQPASQGSFGTVVAATPDVSGDGVADMLVSAPSVSGPSPAPAAGGSLVTGVVAGVVNVVGSVTSPAPAGLVYVVSGADGTVLRAISDPAPGGADVFGAALAAIGDQDGDGIADHLVGEGGAGRLHLFSGRDGRLVRSMAAPAPTQGQGTMALAHAGDRDGDGRDDAWVASSSARSAHLVNGMGAVLASSGSPSAGGSFGAAVASVGETVSRAGTGLVVGDPAEPGGGAAYLLTDPSPAAVAGCAGAACANALRTRAQTPTSTTTTIPATTTVPTTTTTVATTIPADDAMPPTATLPRPASAAADGSALPDTGGVDRSGPGMVALALGMAGITALRRSRQPRPRGEPPVAG
jgi:hypothetical protein